jgi:hypothetical protein
MHVWPILSVVLLVAIIVGFLAHVGSALVESLNNHPGLDWGMTLTAPLAGATLP